MNLTNAATAGMDRGLWLANRARRYAKDLGWSKGTLMAWRDRPNTSGSTTLTWPGYPADFQIRLGGSDVRTFTHVIANDGYDPPFDVDPKVIVDAGANTGMASVWFAKHYPDATVIAVEPDAENYELLLANTASYPNIRPLKAALWTECGTVPLADPGEGPWAYRVDVDSSVPSGVNPVEVPAIDMTTLMDQFGFDFVDIFKCDIEGSELELFADASAWIEMVDMIAIELHDRMKPGCSRSFFAATSDFTDEFVRDEDLFVRRPSPSTSAAAS